MFSFFSLPALLQTSLAEKIHCVTSLRKTRHSNTLFWSSPLWQSRLSPGGPEGRNDSKTHEEIKYYGLGTWELYSGGATNGVLTSSAPLLRSEIITTIYKHFTSAALARLPGIFHCPSLLTAGCQDSNQGRKLQDDKPGRDPPSLSLFLAR